MHNQTPLRSFCQIWSLEEIVMMADNYLPKLGKRAVQEARVAQSEGFSSE
jgi:hypothetical protein